MVLLEQLSKCTEKAPVSRGFQKGASRELRMVQLLIHLHPVRCFKSAGRRHQKTRSFGGESKTCHSAVTMGDNKRLDEDITLKPKMTLLNGVTVIVGSIIGSGIFVSPTGVLLHTGSVNMSLIVWTLSGVFSMVSTYAHCRSVAYHLSPVHTNITIIHKKENYCKGCCSQ